MYQTYQTIVTKPKMINETKSFKLNQTCKIQKNKSQSLAGVSLPELGTAQPKLVLFYLILFYLILLYFICYTIENPCQTVIQIFSFEIYELFTTDRENFNYLLNCQISKLLIS